jgi:hypothetical protein
MFKILFPKFQNVKTIGALRDQWLDRKIQCAILKAGANPLPTKTAGFR